MESQILKEIQALKLKKVRSPMKFGLTRLVSTRLRFHGTGQSLHRHRIRLCILLRCPGGNGESGGKPRAQLVQCLPALFFTTPGNAERGKGNTNGDWISFLVAAGVSSLGFDLDVGVWSRAISLLLTGVLVLSSLARILQSVSGVIRLTSRTAAAGFLLLSLGQLFVSDTVMVTWLTTSVDIYHLVIGSTALGP